MYQTSWVHRRAHGFGCKFAIMRKGKCTVGLVAWTKIVQEAAFCSVGAWVQKTGPWVQKASGGPWVQKASGGPCVHKASGGPWVQKTSGGPWVQKASGGPWVQKASRRPWVQKASGGPLYIRHELRIRFPQDRILWHRVPPPYHRNNEVYVCDTTTRVKDTISARSYPLSPGAPTLP